MDFKMALMMGGSWFSGYVMCMSVVGNIIYDDILGSFCLGVVSIGILALSFLGVKSLSLIEKQKVKVNV